MIRPRRWLGLGAVLGCLAAATEEPVNAEAEASPRQFAVRTRAGDEALAEAVRSGAFQRWYVPSNGGVELAVGPEAVGDVVIEAQVLPVDARLRQALEGLPIDAGGDGIVFDGTHYPSPRYSLALRLPEAETPTWVVVGYDPRSVGSLVDQLLLNAARRRFHRRRIEGDYLVWENRYSQRSGKWQEGVDGFSVDPDERDDMAERAATYAALAAIDRPHVVLRVPPEKASDRAYLSLADELEAAVRRMAPRVPVELGEPLEILVEKDYVAMGRHLASIGETVADAAGRLHLVFEPRDLDAYRYGVARTLIRRAGLELPPRFEDGAALWLSRRWYGSHHDDWLADLAYGRVLPTADLLLADDPRTQRTDVLDPPVTAAVVDRLRGDTVAAKLSRLPSAAMVAATLRSFEAPAETGAPAERPVAKTTSASSSRRFHHGISFAMSNGLEVGYHAPGVDEQLLRLRRLGADAVSLMPFAGQQDPHKPQLVYYNGGPSSESDVGMIHAARRADARGFQVFWKPHLWVRHDSWPGEIEMTSQEDWTAWWSHYRRYILRHAVLAEHAESELFAVGVELGKTVGREAQWRHLIRAVRRVFSGRVTYCGNWWGDYERVGFWDELDYVGVDAYFPLSDRSDADHASLEAGARRAVAELRAASERFGKPVLLTEVGFAARKGSWVSPHEEGGEYAEAHQALAYEKLLEALGRPPWLAGLYVWKAFSHPSIDAGERPDFQFLGRPAEEVVRGYFRSASKVVVPTAPR